MPNLAPIAGIYTFVLFGADGSGQRASWVTVVGVGWIIVMTAICYIGIELSARTQVGLLGAEIVILVAVRRRGPGQGLRGHVAHAVKPSLELAEPLPAPARRRRSRRGCSLAIFIYWGWDTAVTVNEEAKDSSGPRAGPRCSRR